MNRFLILCSFLSLLPVWSYGQSFPSFADRPEWTYAYFIFGQAQTPSVITMSEETMICGQLWNKLITNNPGIAQQWPDTTSVGYTRTVGEKTYFRKSANCSRPEWLLYDFSLVQGDTFHYRWHYPFDTTDLYAIQVPLVVYNVGWWDLGGVMRKVIDLAGIYNDGINNYLATTWIEGIGALQEPFVSLLDTDSYSSEISFGLMCARYGESVKYAAPQSPCAYNYTRLHVKHDVQGGRNDGSNWANAFRRLEDAIAVADPGDSIWVARGTYYPTTGSDKTAYFDLKNGLSIIGGFAGTETDYAQRLPQENETILSGDIGVTGERSDNSFHVVYAHAADSTSLLEGFTIAHGNADSTLEISHWAYGGGMVILPGTQSHYRSAPRLRHCRFVDNYARYGGGLAYFTGIEHSARADVRYCRFERNKARFHGGGLLWQGTAPAAETQVVADCVFEDGYAFWGGGGMAVHNATANFLLERCTFERDSCQDGGGGFQLTDLLNEGQVVVKSCRFVSNYGNGAGGLAFFSVPIYQKFTLRIESSEFVNNINRLNGGGAINIESSGDTTFVMCIGSLFDLNYSGDPGGAMNILTLRGRISDIRLNNCHFKGNRAGTSWGGALYIWGQLFGERPESYTQIENCQFSGNRGAIGLTNGQSGIADMHIRNSTFYSNGTAVIAKPWQEVYNEQNYARISLSNTVLWEPGLLFRRILSNNSPYYNLNLYRLDNCLVSAAECPDLPGSGQACGEGMLYGLDPMFADSAGGDFRPLPCSPLLDAGNNLWLPNADTDLAGQPRILGGTVDIGAYEVPAFRIGASEILRSPACHDSAEGAVSISTEAGQPFDLHWFNAAGQEGAAAENLYAGTYTFVAEHSSGCTDTLNLVLEAPAPIEADIVVTPASNATATDGVALVQQITGGTAPYDIRWSNGASANGIGGLLPGDYTVSITDANDCLFTQTVTVSFTNAVPETQVLPGVFRVAPNPSGSEGAQLRAEAALPGAVRVEILDALGRRAAAAMYLRERSIDLPRGLSPGMYLIVLRDEQGRQAVLRWVVIKR